jgi:hypothetical protein
MLNPIRNVERAPGPGGPEFSLAGLPKTADPLRRKPHNYPVKRKSPIIAVHLAIPKMADGGDVEPEAGPDPRDLQEPDDNLSPRDQQMKEIVVEAMAALRGQHPDPEKALQRFVAAFGENELRELEQMVSQAHPEPDEDEEGGPPDGDEDDSGGAAPAAPAGMQVGGLLHGPGSGQDDQIEAATPAGRKVLLSDGEYVIDAPTVAALGDGSTDAGARRLDHFRKAVRQQSYGHDEQAKPLRKGGRAALLEALNR